MSSKGAIIKSKAQLKKKTQQIKFDLSLFF